jgi:hypothetical protein
VDLTRSLDPLMGRERGVPGKAALSQPPRAESYYPRSVELHGLFCVHVDLLNLPPDHALEREIGKENVVPSMEDDGGSGQSTFYKFRAQSTFYNCNYNSIAGRIERPNPRKIGKYLDN